MMRDKHLVQLAQTVGWNVEHEVTNQMLVKFGRKLLSEVQQHLVEHSETLPREEEEIVKSCVSLFDSFGE